MAIFALWAGLFCLAPLVPRASADSAGISATRAGTLSIEAMTSPEVAAAIRAGRRTIILPTGGIEQNGPHLALGKHNAIVALTAQAIAAELGDALVAPVIAVTPQGDVARREGHTAFAGTITIPPAVFEAVLRAHVESFAAHGFTTILIIGDSGPAQAPQARLAEAMDRELAPRGVRVLALGDYYAENGGEEHLVRRGHTREVSGRHAGLRDTAELLAAGPALVRLDLFTGATPGVDGDPPRATSALGEELLQLKVAAAVHEARRRLAEPRHSAAGRSSGMLGWLASLFPG
ncbi:MAG: creatininase family protein [Hyphomicrobiaceae bacterium]|nr:creatininase family protein [Hyphomicrobiaceae bacterium]